MTIPHLSKTRDAGALVFISGQLPFDRNNVVVGEGIAKQTEQVLANLRTVLEGVGLDLADVVKTTVWLRRASDFAGFNEAYAAAFQDSRPARSCVVCELVVPSALVEIEAIAVRGSR